MSVNKEALYDSICDAHTRIGPNIVKTPLVRSQKLSRQLGCNLYLKMEHKQRTGSFKLRGAHNKLSLMARARAEDPALTNKTIVTASTGNHGLACLDAMSRYKIQGKIVVPETISKCKSEKLSSLGADLVYHGTDCEQSEVAGRDMATPPGHPHPVEFVSPYNDLEVVAGQGTLGLEILDQCPDLDYVFVAVGGGGLVSGVAAAIKDARSRPGVRIVGCQPAASPVMSLSVEAGKIVEFPSLATLSEATAGGVEAGAVTFPLCDDLVDSWCVLSEEDIKWGMATLWQEEKERVEGAAGMCLAAVRRLEDEVRDKTVVVILCGGNIDPEAHDQIII